MMKHSDIEQLLVSCPRLFAPSILDVPGPSPERCERMRQLIVLPLNRDDSRFGEGHWELANAHPLAETL